MYKYLVIKVEIVTLMTTALVIFRCFVHRLLCALRHSPKKRTVLPAAALAVTLIMTFAVAGGLGGIGAATPHASQPWQAGEQNPISYLPAGDAWQIPDLAISALLPRYASAQVQDDTPPTFVSSELDSETGALTITFSEDIDATPNTRIDPGKIHIRESNHRTGGVTLTAAELVTTADGATISFTLNVAHLLTVAELDDPKLAIDLGAVQDTSGNIIEGAFDVSAAAHVRKHSVKSEVSAPTDVEFSNDGTKMFVVDDNGGAVIPYALDKAFNLTNVSPLNDTFSLSPHNPDPQSLEFSNDGTKMFVVGTSGNVTGYALSTAFDVSTATYVSTFNVKSVDALPQGLAFSNDGTKMFIVGKIDKHVHGYTLFTAFDVSTAVPAESFSVRSQAPDPFDAEFSNDGTKMFVIDKERDDVHEYTLSTAFDVSTTTPADAFSVASEGASPRGVAFSNDGTKMFVVGSSSLSVNEYALSSTYPLDVVSNTVPAEDHFVTTWSTDAANGDVTIPVYSGPTYYYTVIWGDGTNSTGVTGDATHTYVEAGDYQVRIYGTFPGIHLNGHGHASKLASIDQWGSSRWVSMESAFSGASSMEYAATDAPDLSGVTNMNSTFSGASTFNGDLSDWNVLQVTDMSYMFANAGDFDGNISNWNVSQVTDMSYMFISARTFDGNISNWNVSQVTDMSNMFSSASNFNQPLNGWDVSAVTTMSHMFFSASAFDLPLNDWNVSSVTDMSNMFYFAFNFNKPLNNWNVSAVTTMSNMFGNAIAFEQNLGNWYVVANDTSIARDDVPGVVAELSAQNARLDGHSPTYGKGTGSDWEYFEITGDDGNLLNMTSVDTKGTYYVNVTASSPNIFGNDNSWHTVKITVIGDTGPPVPVLTTDAVMPTDDDSITVSVDFGKAINATTFAISDLFVTGGTASDLTHLSDNRTFTFTLTPDTAGQVDIYIPAGSITDLAGNANAISNTLQIAIAPGLEWFVTTWNTGTDGEGVTLPLDGTGITIDWGDGNISTGISVTETHIYADAGNHTVSISGGLERIILNNTASASKLISIDQWGSTQWTSMKDAFNGAANMVYKATDVPDLLGVQDMSGMFENASSFNGTIGSWNVSQVTDMSSMFSGASAFNQPLNGWNVLQVTDMGSMFSGASKFNQLLNGWNVSQVTDMSSMFSGASAFNQPLNGWNVSQVTDMGSMFSGASEFNQLLNGWNVSQVTDMSSMFSGASSLHQNLGPWYITLDSTTIARSSVPNVVDTISPQNSYLNRTAPGYAIGTGGDSGLFEIVNGDQLNMASVGPKSAYTVNVTASGGALGAGNHYRMVDITVTGTRDSTGDFVTTWRTYGNDEMVTIPVYSGLTYDYTVIWGDGSADTGVIGVATHTYAVEGDHKVSIYGTFPGIHLDDHGDAYKLVLIDQWGSNRWASMESAFKGASDMRYEATDAPDLSGVTDMNSMFSGARTFDGDLSNWDVSQATDMNHMFHDAATFNGDISSWNVSQVINMNRMLSGAAAFDRPLSDWNVSQVTDMGDMFSYAAAFDRPLSDWDVSSVTDMSFMFYSAASFNSDLSRWNVSAVTDMSDMFDGANAFGQNLGNWYVVANATSVARDDVPGVVAELSAQNAQLDVYSLTYGNGTGGDWEYFEITGDDGNLLNMTSASTKGTYYVNVTAGGTGVFSDGNNWRVLEITVIGQANTVPSVNAGPDQTVGEGDTVTLSGTATYPDEDDSGVSYTWSAPSDSEITFDDSASASTTFTAPAVTADTTFTLTLTASDGTDPGTDTVDVTVKDTSGAFITTWSTGNIGGTVSIPVYSDPDLTYDYTVIWGDGSADTGVTGVATHTYAVAGDHKVSIYGTFPGIHLDGHVDASNLASIDQWGSNRWASMESAFKGASDMRYEATDAPDLSGVTDMNSMFSGARTFDGDLSNWNVSQVTDMNHMFHNAATFNGDISPWNVSQVNDMNSMFSGAASFNDDISSWSVLQVTDMGNMFNKASAFDRPLNDWDVSSVTDMSGMFSAAESFNSDLSSWNVSAVTDMSAMFDGANAFEQNLGNWYVVANATSIARDDVPGVVAELSTQNAQLDVYSLTYGNGTGGDWEYFEITGDDGNLLNMTSASTKGTYYVNVTAGGTGVFSDGNNWRVLEITVIGQANTVPSVNAGPDQTVGEGDTVTLSGTATYPDEDDSGVSYTWSAPSDSEITFDDSASASTTFTAPAVTADTTFTLTLTAFNGTTSGEDMVDVTVKETSEAFITTWRINAGDILAIPVHSDPNLAYDYTVIWGDGSINTGVTSYIDHTYAAAGSYKVSIYGTFPRIHLDAYGDAYKLVSIDQWGSNRWASMESAFKGASDMRYEATDAPDLSGVTDMNSMFSGARTFDGDLSGWDVSGVTDMANMFLDTRAFDGDLSGWNVSSVTDMSYMFHRATAFDQDLNNWNVSSVTNMSNMFRSASDFNRDLNNWNVSSVTDMSRMFQNAHDFNDDISSWNVSKVTDMSRMFQGATAFNDDISGWNVSKVTDMSSMFQDATAFSHDLNSWNTSSVTNMSYMFNKASAFNGNISSWDVSSVTTTSSMFFVSRTFNQDLNSWNVSSVTDMSRMFQGAYVFNGDISSWNVSKVTYMSNMFLNAHVFNGTLSSWNVSSVTDMSQMFLNARAFNQDLNSWNVSSVTTMPQMFQGTRVFNGDISDWNVSSVLDMSQMFDSADSFEQNLGNWYVVANATSIASADIPGVVAEISAQNSKLDEHAPTYRIVGNPDSEFFEIVGGNQLNMTSAGAKSSYMVNVTASGLNVFEDGNNWRVLEITVIGQANVAPALDFIGTQGGYELSLITFTANATDGNSGDTLTFSLDAGAPEGASMNSTTGVFTWTPTETQDGLHTITVRVRDGASADAAVVLNVTVSEANTNPVLESIDPQSVNRPLELTFTASATDDDVIGGKADALTFSLDTGAPEGASMNSTSGVFTWTPAANHVGNHTVTVRVSDNLNATNSKDVLITVTESNVAPALDFIGTQGGYELSLITFTANATDGNSGDTLTFSLDAGAPEGASMNSTTGVFTWTPTETQDGLHTITVRVRDGASADAAVDVTVTVSEVNALPTAEAGTYSPHGEGMTVTLSSSGSTDLDIINHAPDSLTYLWHQTGSGRTVTLSGANTTSPTFESLTVFQNTTLTFELTVTDGAGTTGTDTATVLITDDVNELPDAEAGLDKTVDERVIIVTLNGTGSHDDNPADSLSYRWSQTGGTPAVVLLNNNTDRASFETPAVAADQSLRFTLNVTDSRGGSDTDEVVITVLDSASNAPVADIAGGSMDVDENTPVTLNGSGSYDPNGDALTYRWSQTGGTPDVGLSPANDTASFTTPVVKQDTQLTFTLTVNDGNEEGDASVTITVNNNESDYPVAVVTGPLEADENSIITLNGLRSSDPNGDTLTYLWTAPQGITLSNATAPAPTFTAPQVVQPEDLEFELTVRDTDGNQNGATLAVRVLNSVNEPPDAVVTGPPDVGENVIITLNGSNSTDPNGDDLSYEWEYLTGTPVLALSGVNTSSLEFETPNVHGTVDLEFRLTVTDLHGDSDTADLTVTLQDNLSNIPVSVPGSNMTVANGALVVLNGSRSYDPNDDAISYKWAQIRGPDVALLNPDFAVTKFQAPNVRTDATMEFSLKVTDVDGSSVDTVSVAVQNLQPSTSSSSRSSAPPPAITLGSQGHPDTPGTIPSGPLQPVPADNTSAFPLVIDGNGYALHSDTITIVPTSVTAGRPVTITATIYDPLPILYFGIYLHLPGQTISYLQSDTQVEYNSGKIRVTDPGGLLRDTSITISGDPDNPSKKIVTLTSTFTESMGNTNMVIRTWNTDRQSSEVRIFNALAVVVPDAADPEPDAADPEPDTVDSEHVLIPGTADPDPAADSETAGHHTLAIRMWSGFEPESITDDQLLDSLGLDYRGANIPDWVMTELGPLVVKKWITLDEFMTALQYVLEHNT